MNYRKELVETKLWLSAWLALALAAGTYWALEGNWWEWIFVGITAWWLCDEITDAWKAHQAGKDGLAL